MPDAKYDGQIRTVIPKQIRFFPDTFESTLLEHFAQVPIGTLELSLPIPPAASCH